MANSNQAKKRARQAVKRNRHNASRRSEMRTYIKKVRAAIEKGDKETAQKDLIAASSIIDRVANRGLIHKNAAARYKSRLSKQVKSIGEKAA